MTTDIKKLIFVFSLVLSSYFVVLTSSYAELLERVVAIVNDDVILFSELDEAMKRAGDKERIDILNKVIDRRLLLKEAERFIPIVKTSTYSEGDDTIIKEYINIRIRPFIRIPIREIESYYMKNKELFKDREFYNVKDEIEAIITEEAVMQRLDEHLKELREKAYIRIQLGD